MHRTAADYVERALKSGDLPDISMDEIDIRVFRSLNKFLYSGQVPRWVGCEDVMYNMSRQGLLHWELDDQCPTVFNYFDMQQPFETLLYWSARAEQSNAATVWEELDALAQRVVFDARLLRGLRGSSHGVAILKKYLGSPGDDRPSLFIVFLRSQRTY